MQCLKDGISRVHESTKALTPHQQLVLVGVSGFTVGAGLVYTVLRCCGGCGPNSSFSGKESKAIYDSEASARQYMEFHYTPSRDSYVQKPRQISEAFDFPTRVAQKFRPLLLTEGNTPTKRSPASARMHGERKLRALDVGCATGASVFEMSKVFDEVIGFDLSEVFIHLANEVKRTGVENASADGKPRSVPYTAPVQGSDSEPRELILPKTVRPERCFFYAGDAMNIVAESAAAAESRPKSRLYDDVEHWKAAPGETFDAILCLNLIDRVPDPLKLLRSFAPLLNKGGILILGDPYSWWEGATAKEKWLGGKDGIRSENIVKKHLVDDFELVQESEEPFLIRNHVRHYQLGFSHCLVMRRK